MNSKTFSVSTILLTLCLSYTQLVAAPVFVEGELLVKWRDGPDSHAAALGNSVIGSTVKRNFNAIGWQHVQLPPAMSVRDGIAAYQALGTVLAVEPDGSIEPIPPPKDGSADVPPAVSGVAPDAPTSDNRSGKQSERRGLRRDTEDSPPAAGPPQPSPPLPPSDLIPNDTMFSQQWYLRKIGATNAWAITAGSSNIVVAIFDSGVDYTHPDLAANMWRNPGETGLDDQGRGKAKNGIDDDGNGYVDDVYGIDAVNGTGDPMDTGILNPNLSYHGTFIAGIIGAVGNNRQGITGLNWSVQIMAIRRTGGLESADPLLTDRIIWSRILAAWDYVIQMKRRGVNIRVANHSYGGSSSESAAVRDAFNAAGSEGILSVFAALNSAVNSDLDSSFQILYNFSSGINVAASTESDMLADFSNYGKSTVDIAAPGINMTSTGKGASYVSGASGTSFACPLVAGAAALLLAVNPNLTVDQLKAALFGSVDQPAALRGKVVTNGRLNVERALQYLTNGNPPAIVITALPNRQWTPTNAPIQVTFNRPMNRATVENAFVIKPSVSGAFEWSVDNRSFSYLHDAPFDATTNYTVRILGTAQDDVGGAFDGNFNRAPEGSPKDDFVSTFRCRDPNDDFANAQWLTGASGSVEGSDRYATTELDEPGSAGYHASVWYRWTPPEPGGWFTFDLTSGTAFDSLLAVYNGDQLDRVVAVASNDNYGGKTSSRVSLAAAAPTNYSVVVAGKGSIELIRAGNFKLAWYPTPPPGFTGTQFSPIGGVPGTRVTLTGTNFTGAGTVLFNGASASFTNALTNNLDLRITAIVPPDAISGPITIVTPHGSVTSTALFQVLPPPLRITPASTSQLIVRWGSTSTEFLLESSEQIQGAIWVAVPEKLVIEKEGSRVTIATTPTTRFLRLRKTGP